MSRKESSQIKFSTRHVNVVVLLIVALGVSGLAIKYLNNSKAGPITELAFPTAEGFGANARGGRGGKVIEVTNLADAGDGSLRACAEATGPRTCVFRTGGTITTTKPIIITSPYITIAGQTAPGGGITLRAGATHNQAPMWIHADHVIIRYVRFRAGPAYQTNVAKRALEVKNGAQHVMIDHCSMSWGTDETFTLIDGPRNITVQWSIVSETLSNSTHKEGEHSRGFSVSTKKYGATTDTGAISMHHNLLAHNRDRNPEADTFGVLDMVNNVIYNPNQRVTNIGDRVDPTTTLESETEVNIVNNYYKRGPNTATSLMEIIGDDKGPGAWPLLYVKGNMGYHTNPQSPDDQTPLVTATMRSHMVNDRRPAPQVTTTSAVQAYTDVLAKAGARVPTIDAVDKRILKDVETGQGSWIDCPGSTAIKAGQVPTDPSYDCATKIHLKPSDYARYGIIDVVDSDGWPILDAGVAPADSDKDGMPDSWEHQKGLNTNLDDSAGKKLHSYYTNLEVYLQYLVGEAPGGEGDEPHPPKDLGLDNVSPIVTLTSPINGSIVKGNQLVQVSASDDKEVARIKILRGTTLLGLAVLQSGSSSYGVWNYTWDTTTGADAVRDLTAQAEDAAGNQTVSTPIKVTIQNAIVEKLGDINKDGKVDSGDIARLLTNYRKSGLFTKDDGDLNNDNVINIIDLSILLSRWTR